MIFKHNISLIHTASIFLIYIYVYTLHRNIWSFSCRKLVYICIIKNMCAYIYIYGITGFFCGCKFMRFVFRVHVIFVTLFFCDFTPWQSDFYSLDDMKKLHVNHKHPLFLGMCIYLEVKLILCSIEHIDQPKQKHLCLVLVNKS